MAFDFLGTFNQAQLERFVAFATTQLDLVDARIAHLSLEQIRIGVVIFRHDADGVPTGYAGDPAGSYVAKLLAAYEVLGGNPFLDLDLRLRTDPVYRRKGDEASGLSSYMSNGEVIGAVGKADAPSGNAFRQARQWLDPTLEHRFDRLERKIRRSQDYADQLQTEIDALNLIKRGADVEGSLENSIQTIMELITDVTYRAIHADTDPRGAGNQAPFSSYDVDGTPAEKPQRQDTGFVPPGGTGPTT